MAGNSESLNIDITAQDQASKVIDGLQKKVDKLEKSEPTVEIEADTKDATKDVDSFAKRLEKLGESDQIVTLALRAGSVQSELSSLIRDVAKLDADDATIDVKVNRINELGGELDELKAKMQAIGDTSIDPDVKDQAKRRLGDIAKESEKAGAAVHSMAGNAIGDFAATSSGVGILGESIAQLTEGVLEGEIAMQDLAKAGLSMGAIGAGVLILDQVMGEFADSAARVAKIKAFHDEEVVSYTKAVKEGATVTETLNKRLADTDKLMATVTSSLDNFGTGFKSNIDISEAMHRNGVSVKLFGDAIAGGETGITNLQKALEQSGVTTKDVTAIISAARSEYAAYAQGQQIAAKTAALSSGASLQIAQSASLSAEAQRLAGQAAAYQAEQQTKAAQASAIHAAEMEANAAAQDVANRSAERATELIDGVNAAIAEQVTALDEQIAALDETRAAQDALIESSANAADSQRAATSAYKKLGETLGDNKATSEDVTDATLAFAKAQEKAKDDAAAAAGQIRTNTERVDSLNDSLLDTAGASETGRAEIVDYIGTLNGIPEEKKTEILAALNAGDVAEAKRILDEASATRTVAVKADATEFDKDVAESKREAAKPVIVPIKYREDQRYGAHAKGGTVGPAGGLAGEAGAEFVQLPGRQAVLIDGPMVVPPRTRVTSVRKTKAIISRRQPRYANGTAIPAAVRAGGMSFTFNQQAPIYGVNDLDQHLARWSQRLAQQISAGKR